MPYTTELQLLTGVPPANGWPHSMLQRTDDATDAQIVAVRRWMLGNGVFYGGVLAATKTCGPTRAVCGGLFVAMTNASNAITGLTDGVKNYVWLTGFVNAALPADTPSTNTGRFTATTGPRPDAIYSVFLGTMTLSAGSVVTVIEQCNDAPLDTGQAGPEYCFPLMMRRARGAFSVGPLPAGYATIITIYNYGVASAAIEDWYFRVPGACIINGAPAGWDLHVYENWAPHWFSLVIVNHSGYTESADLTWERWGIIRPAWTGIWGRLSSPWPGAGAMPSSDEPA